MNDRSENDGARLAGPYTACFGGAKYDLKARYEANNFRESWMNTFMCDWCGAVLCTKKGRPWRHLVFSNFTEHAPHRATLKRHVTTFASTKVVPGNPP